MSNSQENDLSGMPLGLLEQARSGLVNKIKVQNDAYRTGSTVGGGAVGLLGGTLAGLLSRGKGLRRFAPHAGAVGGTLTGSTVGSAAGSLMGSNIPPAVDRPMTPDTIGAVSKFINKQASLGLLGGLAGAVTAPSGGGSEGAGRGFVRGFGIDAGAGLGGVLGMLALKRRPGLGMAAGGLAGGAAGYGAAGGLLGDPSWAAKAKDVAGGPDVTPPPSGGIGKAVGQGVARGAGGVAGGILGGWGGALGTASLIALLGKLKGRNLNNTSGGAGLTMGAGLGGLVGGGIGGYRAADRAVSDKQATVGESMALGAGVGGLFGAADAPRGMLMQGTGRGILQGGATGLGASLGANVGSELSNHGPASTLLGAGVGGLGGMLLANKLLGHAPVVRAKEKEKALAKAAAFLRSLPKG